VKLHTPFASGPKYCSAVLQLATTVKLVFSAGFALALTSKRGKLRMTVGWG
jgi:hypothetical protein